MEFYSWLWNRAEKTTAIAIAIEYAIEFSTEKSVTIKVDNFSTQFLEKHMLTYRL